MRIFTIVALAPFLFILNSCKSAAPAFPPFAAAAPRTVAVLAVEGTLQKEPASLLRRFTGALLADRQYTVLDEAWVDAAAARAGLKPWDAKWIPAEETLAAFGREIGADALLVFAHFEDERVSAAVFYKRGLTGTVKWLDVASRKFIWTAPVAASRSGGVLLESGQIIKAVSDTVGASDGGQWVQLAAAAARDVASAIPEGGARDGLRARPEIQQISIAGDRELAPGKTLQIHARGSARGRAVARVEKLNLQFPMHESVPGEYSGQLRIEPGMGSADGAVSAILYDSAGDASEVKLTKEIVNIRAPRVDPPSDVTVTAVAGAKRTFQIRWSPVEGADHYEVVRVGPGAPVSFPVGAVTEFTDTPPGDAGTFSWSVSTRSASGIPGPPSIPVAEPRK